ncbi:hypothetical protein JRO89_XSUnG0219200 [Xanthoceras sorbifolium]|uniref:Uncharacterized protein n=1 Tax=Xanthoceras sorbifolium TaxID=99658 RepID=A0ABQ8GWZ5_9ROSI|nr:hypothetical protein JRO89_XSUnG0219200 [Xanthoceras sorbifolium]
MHTIMDKFAEIGACLRSSSCLPDIGIRVADTTDAARIATDRVLIEPDLSVILPLEYEFVHQSHFIRIESSDVQKIDFFPAPVGKPKQEASSMKRLGLEGNKSPSPSGSVDGRPFGGAATENVRRTRFAPELDGVIEFRGVLPVCIGGLLGKAKKDEKISNTQLPKLAPQFDGLNCFETFVAH